MRFELVRSQISDATGFFDFVLRAVVKIPDPAFQLVGFFVLVGFAKSATATLLIFINLAHLRMKTNSAFWFLWQLE